MAFRTVVISNEADLHVQTGQLVAIQEQVVWIPLEDIAVLVLENPRVRISSAALSLASQHGVAVAVCDDKHMPTGLLLPHCRFSRQLAVTRQQFAMSLPLKKRLWQRIVQTKIANQIGCLDALGVDGHERMRDYLSSVQSGDSTGMEAAAARLYFKRLLPDSGRRLPGGMGGALDYGYAIVRAAVARSLVGHGFYPAVGIHHDSQLNAFNLADDILEPFRALVDFLAVNNEVDVDTIEGRQTLVSALQMPCRLGTRVHSVLTAIDATVSGFQAAIAERNATLLPCPEFVAPESVPESLLE